MTEHATTTTGGPDLQPDLFGQSPSQPSSIQHRDPRLLNIHKDVLPADAIHIGRNGAAPWSNPWPITGNDSAARKRSRMDVIARHQRWIRGQPFLMHAAATELADHSLVCFCAPQPCHGNTWLDVVDAKAPRPILVFGSNTRGRHGAGAARFAREHLGMPDGLAEGLGGQAYAIPTRSMDRTGRLQTLPVEDIAAAVQRFLAWAEAHPDLPCQVSRLGCGLAGLDDATVAPLFYQAPPSVMLPGRWEDLRRKASGQPPLARIAVLAPGWSEHPDGARAQTLMDRLDHLTESLRTTPGCFVQVVSGGDAGSALGEAWCIQRGLLGDDGRGLARFPAQPSVYGDGATQARDTVMAWYANYFVMVGRYESPRVAALIDLAHREGIKSRLIE